MLQVHQIRVICESIVSYFPNPFFFLQICKSLVSSITRNLADLCDEYLSVDHLYSSFPPFNNFQGFLFLTFCNFEIVDALEGGILFFPFF